MYVNPFWLGFLVGVLFTIVFILLIGSTKGGRK